ncbi:hypothetical protein BJ508DRAFT_139453 [Ascobolus immersus RN42]|uniref:Uncharacterized protein n=1 Tax=Ascobolus immersus RN42 TaxID=1160509 RepID=A0A3N4ID64_ASCIM|nr:hypothetical protein BJ508DRAFT_139453 [Ascobolus immersus RN42]
MDLLSAGKGMALSLIPKHSQVSFLSESTPPTLSKQHPSPFSWSYFCPTPYISLPSPSPFDNSVTMAESSNHAQHLVFSGINDLTIAIDYAVKTINFIAVCVDGAETIVTELTMHRQMILREFILALDTVLGSPFTMEQTCDMMDGGVVQAKHTKTDSDGGWNMDSEDVQILLGLGKRAGRTATQVKENAGGLFDGVEKGRKRDVEKYKNGLSKVIVDMRVLFADIHDYRLQCRGFMDQMGVF